MKVYIGPYKSWIGPYQLAEKLCFWVKDEIDEHGFSDKPNWVHNFGEWLAHGSVAPAPKVGESSKLGDPRPVTRLYKILSWLDSKKERKISVRLDPWDTWSMDHTLSYIILPMLQQIKDDTMGAPFVNDEDVPEELKSTSASPKENEWDTDDNHFKRWDYVLDEMIFAFNTKTGTDQDWEDRFHAGEHDVEWIKQEDGNFLMTRGPDDTSRFDAEGQKAYQARISNGFRLFGKYYESLWR
jgi:hypothetical protein